MMPFTVYEYHRSSFLNREVLSGHRASRLILEARAQTRTGTSANTKAKAKIARNHDPCHVLSLPYLLKRQLGKMRHRRAVEQTQKTSMGREMQSFMYRLPMQPHFTRVNLYPSRHIWTPWCGVSAFSVRHNYADRSGLRAGFGSLSKTCRIRILRRRELRTYTCCVLLKHNTWKIYMCSALYKHR